MASTTISAPTTGVSFQPATIITFQPTSPPTTAPSPPDSRPTTTTSTAPPALPASTPLPSLAELQSELAGLLTAQHANAATIGSLRDNLTSTSTSYSSLISFLQSSLSHRQATIARLNALQASTTSANSTAASTLLESYHASIATAHRLMRQQQSADETKYKSLKQQLSSQETQHRLQRKKQLEHAITAIKQQITADEARRQSELEVVQRAVESERERMRTVNRGLAEGREEREERYRRSVVREIEREKEGMMRVWEEERRCRRERKEESERKRRLLGELEKERERLRQERELRESEAEERRRMMRAREVKKERAMAVREEKEEELRAAVMHSTDDVEEEREKAEDEAAAEELAAHIELEKAVVDRLQAEEKEWTTRGRQLLHGFHETQSLFQCLLHALEVEKQQQPQQLQQTTSTESDGVVEWEAMSVVDRIRLVKLLLYRSRGERGGAIGDTQPEHEPITPPSEPQQQQALPTSPALPTTTIESRRSSAPSRSAVAEAERSQAAAEEWKEQIMERRRSMTGGQLDGRKVRGRSRADRVRGQLSSAPMHLAETKSADEEDGMAVRGASMAREWPCAAVMLPALVAAVSTDSSAAHERAVTNAAVR